MKHFVGKMSKRSQLFIIILVLLGGTSAFASSVKLQTATPYPTDYPPDWQTADAIQRQTREVAALSGIFHLSPLRLAPQNHLHLQPLLESVSLSIPTEKTHSRS